MLKQTHRIAPTRPFARDSHMSDRPVLLVSVSGVRGLIGNGLSADVAARFAAAYGSTIAGKSVVLARDSRPSGTMLRHAVIAGLAEPAARCSTSASRRRRRAASRCGS